MTVRRTDRDGVAVLCIDNPPVNALGRPVRQALLDAAAAVEADPAVDAVVLLGAGALFVGGADITEFDRPLEAPHLPDVLAAIEGASKPWIAAVHGQALGGGLEIALACHGRIAARGAVFGLPEIGLGIIPGAGGTQRLPRLVGVEAALAVAAEHRRLGADEALALGLVDRIADGPLSDAAVAFARDMAVQPLPAPASRRPLDDPGGAFWAAAEGRVAKAAKGETAPPHAVRALRHGVEHGFEAGLAFERETFLTLRAGPEAAALRHLFFAERAAVRPKALRSVAPLPLGRVGVVGGGTMGVGIAAAFGEAGLPVVLVERDAAALGRAVAAHDGLLEAAVARGRLTPEAAEARRRGLDGRVGPDALVDCDLVVEAVYEDLSVKQAVFADLARVCRPDAILATNTSYLDPRRIADGVPGAGRIIGLHFFSPAQVMRLLEIVPLPETSERVLASAFDLARRLGKIPVRSGICDGFIGNRILRRVRAEAEALVRDGIAPAAVDAAMRAFGFAMGPFETQDLAGLDIAFRAREAARARGETVPESLGDVLARAGRLGRKSGGGWYDYRPDERAPRPSAAAEALLAPHVGPARTRAPDAIADQLVAVMAEEGGRILAEGIADAASDIDLVEVHGYGFPRRKGGPMFMAGRRGG